ncbi:hypothetical protein BGX27_010657 [Mortierella sp. AM989]|nr:hypothetical protein BGX27_010657 [Mortierella sp. AM989]
MHITDIPTECILNVLRYLDLPDHHSLLLTCSNLFDKVVPVLYRSPFRAIVAFDGWHSNSSLHPSQENDNKIHHTSIPYSGQPNLYHHLENDSTSSASSTSSSPTSSTSSVSSSRTNNIDAIAEKSIQTHPTSVSATSPPQAQYTPVTPAQPQTNSIGRHQKQDNRPNSLQRRSYSDHAKSNGHGNNFMSALHTNPQHKGSISSVNVSSNHYNNGSSNSNNNNNAPANPTISSLEQLKLHKLTRLLQLLIACTDVQARLPALRYPGYGQQWIRPPCKVDYLQYYVDQLQGGEIMVRCFHLLFADLVQCQWEDESQASGLGDKGVKFTHVPVPITVAPPDEEAYRVLYQILREFMGHSAGRIRTLSVSTMHTIEHATALVPQLSSVTRLELTDLELDQHQNGFQVDQVVDFVKSHRMLFGPILRDITLVGKNPSSSALSSLNPFSSTLISSPTSPTSPSTLEATFAALSTRLSPANNNLTKNHDNHILTVLSNLQNLERLDATEWANCILYLDRITAIKDSSTIPNNNSNNNNNNSIVTAITSKSAAPTKTSSSSVAANLKILWLSFSFPPSESIDSKPARLSDVLERCRKLEQVRIPIRRSDVFEWAAKEKKTSLICAPILANSKTKHLQKIRKLHLHGPSSELMDCVRDATYAFQDTLEELEARSILRVWQPAKLVWEGHMVSLRRLKLEGEVCLHFNLESLKQCPALEELSLSLPSLEAWRFQNHDQKQLSTTSSHRQSHHHPVKSQLSVVRHQAITRIAELKNLKRLTLSGHWFISDIVLRRVADQCLYLKELHMIQTVGTTIGGLLLAVENMSRLESLNLTLDIIDLHLVRVVIRKLVFLTSVQLTNLRQEE